MKRIVWLLGTFAVILLAATTFWDTLIEIEKRFYEAKPISSATIVKKSSDGNTTSAKTGGTTDRESEKANGGKTSQNQDAKIEDLSNIADEKIEAFNRLLRLMKNHPYEVDNPHNPFYDPLKAERLRAKLKTRIAVNRQHGYLLAVTRDELGLLELHLKETIYHFFTTLADRWTQMDEKALRTFLNQNSARLESLKLEKYENAYKRALKSADPISKQIVANYNRARTHYLFFTEFLDYLTANPAVLRYRSLLSIFKLDEIIAAINGIDAFGPVNVTLRHIHTDMGRLSLFVLIMLLSWGAAYFFYYRLYGYLKRLIESEYDETDEMMLANLEGIRRPFFILVLTFGLEMGVEVLYHPAPLPEKLSLLFYAVMLATVTYVVLLLVDSVVFDYFVKKTEVKDQAMRRELINLIVSIVKVLIVIVALSMFLVRMGVNVTGLVASLGIGGLAVALAAQNTLSNFFGLLKIIFDKSFSQGDWIETKDAEGTVVEIGFISTIIRTFDNALITVPNASLANNPLKNWSKRTVGRRIKMTIGVTYGARRDALMRAIEEIETMLRKHPGIASETKIDKALLKERSKREKKLVSLEDKYGVKTTLLVYLDEFADSSVNILVYCFSKSVVWREWLEVKQDVMLKIWEILERHNLEFAFPSESVYFDPENIKSSFEKLKGKSESES